MNAASRLAQKLQQAAESAKVRRGTRLGVLGMECNFRHCQIMWLRQRRSCCRPNQKPSPYCNQGLMIAAATSAYCDRHERISGLCHDSLGASGRAAAQRQLLTCWGDKSAAARPSRSFQTAAPTLHRIERLGGGVVQDMLSHAGATSATSAMCRSARATTGASLAGGRRGRISMRYWERSRRCWRMSR